MMDEKDHEKNRKEIEKAIEKIKMKCKKNGEQYPGDKYVIFARTNEKRSKT